MYKKWFGNQDHTAHASPRAAAGAAPTPSQATPAQCGCSSGAATAVEDSNVGVAPQPAYPLGDAAVVIGLQGFWCCLLGPPVLAAASAIGLEPFSWPPGSLALGYVVVALMMAMYMACLYGALAYSSPTFVAICSLFVTPVTLIWDVAAGRAGGIPGTAFIGLGVLISALLLVIYNDPGDRLMKRRVAACVVCLGCPEAHSPLIGDARPVAAVSEGGVHSSSERGVS